MAKKNKKNSQKISQKSLTEEIVVHQLSENKSPVVFYIESLINHIRAIRKRYLFISLLILLLLLIIPFTRSLDKKPIMDSTLELKTTPTPTIAPIKITINNPGTRPFILAQGSYVEELSTHTQIFEKNKDIQLLPASTTKIISVLTAMDVFKPEDVLEVKRVIDIGQTADLIVGEKLTFESLLNATLIHSANDAAYVLADNYPGGYNKFLEAMNEKAKKLGMKNSFFRNPAGLDSYEQNSTAYDMAIAGKALLEYPLLAKIVSTKSITISDTSYTYFHPLYNVNSLLGEVPGVAGIKTGKTDLAGENLITYFKRNNEQYIIVILKSTDRFADTRSIIEWIKANVEVDGN